MEFTGTTLQVWTMQSLWIALAISIGATLTFALLFLIGFIAQSFRPDSRFSRYFQETNLFALWMVSMICGVGLSLLLFILGVHRFSSENQFISGFLTTLSFAAVISPVFTVYAITHTHVHATRKRARISGGKSASTKPRATKKSAHKTTSNTKKTSSKRTKK